MLLASAKDGLQLRPVGSDHFLLLFGCFDDHRDLIVIAVDEGFSPLKLGNGPNLSPGQLQDILDILGFILLQVQNDLVLGVIDDGPTVLTVVQAEEVRKVEE